MKRVFRFLIFVCCLALLRQPASAATTISVDLNSGYVIDGHNQVQDGIFGLTTYNGAPIPAVPTMNQALTEPGIRMLGFPGIISWVSPPSLPANGAAGIASWYASQTAMDQMTNGPLNGATYLYGQILPATEALGIHPMVYLLNGPSWLMSGPSQAPIPTDMGLYTATVTGYVGLLRRIDPQLKLFHLWNEPSSSWYTVNKNGQDYASMFNQIAQGVKQNNPDVLIGGPVLCCQVGLPEAGPNYVAWEQWTKPVIENTGTNLDFFDYHAYDWTDSPDRSVFLGSTLEELNLVTNYMQLWKGKSVPVVISESGVALSTSPVDEWSNPVTHWQRRTWPWAQHLFSFLERPDQILSLQMFDLMADIGNGMEFIRADYPASRSPTYWLYWLMRHTGGYRLAPTWSPIPGVQILATRQSSVSVGTSGGPYAAVTILNNSGSSQDFNVQWAGASGTASWERLYLNGTQLGRDIGTGTLITLPAQSVGVVYLPVSGLANPTPTMERDDFFGNTVMQDFAGVGQNLNFSVNVPDNALIGMTSAYLQVGLLNSVAADGITLTAAGQTVPLQGNAYFQEIPLQRAPVSGQNTFAFRWASSNHATPVRISSVRLRMERQLSSQPPPSEPALPSVPAPYQCVRNFYVSNQGSDQNSGTSPTSAFATLQHASNGITHQGGDCIIALPGIYNEGVGFTANGSGDTPTGYVVLKSQVQYAAKIIVPNGGSGGIYLQGNYLIVDGFDVSNSAGQGIATNGPYHHQKFLNNLSHDNGCGGIAAGGGDYFTIQGNISHDNAKTSTCGGSGISIYEPRAISDSAPGFHNIIRENIVYGNIMSDVFTNHSDGSGIILDDNDNSQTSDPNWQNVHYPYQTLVENNLVVNNGGAGIVAYLSDHVTVRNNTVYHNERDPRNIFWWGELQNADSSNNTWANNIAYADLSGPHGDNAILDNADTSHSANANVQWTNNLTFDGTPNDPSVQLLNSSIPVTKANGNLLGANPLLINPSMDTTTWNFALSSQSPAISTGTSNHPSADLLGIQRPTGPADLGAYQHSASASIAPNELVYPPDSGMIDVTQAPYFADKTGATDATHAIQRAISDYVSAADSSGNSTLASAEHRTTFLFFPSGTYKISKTLAWQDASGNYGAYLGFQGENSTGTVLQLVDNAPGFNNPANPQAVIFTASAVSPGATGDTAFNNNVWNMTINTGRGNPGAEGISWLANNWASLRNVTIVSGDGQGRAGIDLTRSIGGPDLMKNVSITGFDYGILTGGDWVSTTIEHLLVRNQNIAGIELDYNVLSIRDMTSVNSVPAIHEHEWAALLTLIDGHFSGGSPDRSAIETDTDQSGAPGYYLRNIQSSGYKSALTSSGTVVNGNTITELTSQPVQSLFPSPAASLNLPIQETPDYVDPNLSHWANIQAFGAVADGFTAQTDNTRAIQAAIDSGATTVYFPRGYYAISGTLHVRGAVHKLIGYDAGLVPTPGASALAPVFMVDSGAASPVVFENFIFTFQAFPTIQDNSAGTLVLSDLGYVTYTNQAGAGPLFIENISPSLGGGTNPRCQFNNQTVWARQLDPEGNGIPANNTVPAKIVNNGGSLWILGLKTEGYYTPAILTKAGGRTELLGAMIDNDENPQPAPAQPAIFVNQESRQSLVYQTGPALFGYGDWPTQISETRGGVTRTMNSLHNYYGDTVMPLYAGYPAPPVPSTQTVTVAINTSTGIVLNAADPNGFSMTYSIVTPPSNGALSGSPPNLTYTPNPGYLGPDSFSFTASDGFSTSASTPVSVNVTSWYAATWHGSAFRNVKDFGAKGDGTTDDTAAIQAAINWNQPLGIKIPAVIYVPPGTYKISNTIVLWYQAQLMGDEATPPTFVLAANSPGFANPSLKKPVLVTAGGTNVDPASLNWQANGDLGGSANNTFFNQIHNLNLILQSGNSGAVGILWKVAQQTSLRNLTITSVDAAIGIDLGGSTDYVGGFVPTQPGGGTIEDVSITGGNTGLRAAFPAQWTFRSLHIQNQTATGVLIPSCWGLTFVDLEVSNVPVGMSYSGVMMNILDSRFQSTGQALVTDGSPYYVENTIGLTPPGGAQFAGAGYTDGVALSTGSVPMTRKTPMMLRSRPALYPISGTIINVHDVGAHGDGVTDDTTILQQAINHYDTVFLPYGTYLISNTLTLRPNSRIFGEAETQIMLAAGAPGFSDPSHPKPMILAPDNASAQTVMANFQIVPGAIGTPNNLGAILIQWGAGSASGIWDVCPFGNANDSVPDAIQLNLIGHGGGVFSNMWMPGHASISGFLGNSSGPAWFYSMEAEHHLTHGFTISQAANYYFVMPQTELSPTAFEVDGSTHIWAYTLAGSEFTAQPADLLKFSSSNDLSIQGFLLHDMADYCITMPATPGGACQLHSGTPVSGFNFTSLSLLRFSPLSISTPSLTSISPTIITAGDPGFALTLNGINLLAGCTAYWNGLAIETHDVNATQVTASVPASYFVAVGTAGVQVLNPDGGTSNSLPFSIVPPPQTPDLSGWPAFIPIDGTLNLPAQPGDSYQWVFTPKSAGASSLDHALGTSATNSASTLTQAPALSLEALALSPGEYDVQVMVINAAGKSSAPARATITLVTVSSDLGSIRVYPNPFRSARGDTQMTFDQMPAGSTVKIFTVSTRLVKTLSALEGIALWDMTNDSGDKVASGIYLYLITDGQGNKAHGKLTVIR